MTSARIARFRVLKLEDKQCSQPTHTRLVMHQATSFMHAFLAEHQLMMPFADHLHQRTIVQRSTSQNSEHRAVIGKSSLGAAIKRDLSRSCEKQMKTRS